MRARQPTAPATIKAAAGPEAATVPEVMQGMGAERRAAMAQLRDMALALPGAEERSMYDAFCREWTPAYYLGRNQLFHVHNFRKGLRATMFVGANTLTPVVLDSEEVAHGLRLLVASTPAPSGTRMVKVPLDSQEDVRSFMDLVRLKWEYVQSRQMRCGSTRRPSRSSASE